MRGEAFRLAVLELLLLLLFLPVLLLWPWRGFGLSAAPLVLVLGGVGSLAAGVAWWRARRAEDLLSWREAAIFYGVGPGLWLWAAGVAFRLGERELGVLALAAAGFFLALLGRFPGPGKGEDPPSR